MFTTSVCHRVYFWIVTLSFLFLGTAVQGQPIQNCQEALSVSGGGVSLGDTETTTATKTVDEWESDIIKLTVTRPGVLVLSGEGSAVQGSLHTADPAASSPLLEDAGPLGTAHRPLTVVVRPGEHCVEVAPPSGATGTLRVRATFFDVCNLGPQDDHGDSFLCATEAGLSETLTGEASSTDQDVFSFDLSAAVTAMIAVTGDSGLSVSLYGEDGTLLAGDARGSQALAAGKYFVRIAGAGEPETYGLTVSVNP